MCAPSFSAGFPGCGAGKLSIAEPCRERVQLGPSPRFGLPVSHTGRLGSYAGDRGTYSEVPSPSFKSAAHLLLKTVDNHHYLVVDITLRTTPGIAPPELLSRIPATRTMRNYDWEIPPEGELRLVLAAQEALTITLRNGSAEVFGSELPSSDKGTKLVGPCKFAIFSFAGCKVRGVGLCQSTDLVRRTPVPVYLKAFASIDAQRTAAKTSNIVGPRVLIAGPVDVGKSTLCTTLLNWSARRGRSPLFVDLDVGQGVVSIPGTVAATQVSVPLPIHEEIQGNATPVVYNYGHSSPAINPENYTAVCRQLNARCLERINFDAQARSSGMIVNTCGWTQGLGYKLLLDLIDILAIDTVLVLGEPALYKELASDLRGRSVHIKQLPKSDGVLARSASYRASARAQRIRQYFYGTDGTLCPMSTVIPFSNVQVFRVNMKHPLIEGREEEGYTGTGDVVTQRVEPSNELVHHVLAVSFATSESEVVKANVAGFVYCQSINEEQGTITILSPSPGPLPNQVLVMGTVTWSE